MLDVGARLGEYWCGACSMYGVRIPAAATSVSTTTPMPMRSSQGGSSFHMALANASAADQPERKPISRNAARNERDTKDSGAGGESAEAVTGDTPVATVTSDSVKATPEATAAADGGTAGQGNQATSADTAQATVSQAAFGAVHAALFNGAQEMAQGSVGQNGISVSDSSTSAAALDAASSPVRASGKQERPRTPVPAVQGTLANAMIPDPISAVIAAVFGSRGSNHDPSSEVAGDPAKHGSDPTLKEQDTAKATVDAGGAGAAEISNAPAAAAGVDVSVFAQVQQEVLQAGLGLPAIASAVSGQIVVPVAPTSMVKGVASVEAAGAKSTASVDGLKGTADGTGDSTTRSSEGSAQGQPSAPSDLSKPGVTALKTAVSETLTASNAMHVVSHEVLAAQHGTNGAADAPRATKAQDLPASAQADGTGEAAATGINAAKLIQNLGQTEMHVGMHSEEFGDISIRTAISQQEMVTQISLNHSDLSQAIATHVSNMQTKLGEEYGLHASILVNNQGTPFSGNTGGSSQGEAGSYGRSPRKVSIVAAEGGVNMAVAVSPIDGPGLDIRI